METLGTMRSDCHNHIAQTLTITELPEHQCQKLVPAGEMLDILVTFVFADEIVEMVPVKECCQLGEYKLVFEHKQSLKGCKGANSSPLTLKTDRK